MTAPGRRLGNHLRRTADRLPLRVKLVALVLTLAAGALLAADLAATTSLRGYLLGRVDSQLAGAAGDVVSRGGRAYSPRDAGDRGFRPPSEYYISVADFLGDPPQVGNDPAHKGQFPPAIPRLTQAQAARQTQPFTVGSRQGSGQWRVVAVPVSFTDGRPGVLFVATNLAEVRSTLTHLGFLMVVTGLGVLLLLGGLAYLLVRSSLRPLVAVEETAAAIAAGDLSRRVPDHHPRTEVGRLAAAVNGMLGQIESAFGVQRASESAARASEERMRRFVADASHELRTPLTSIRGFAELYRQGAVRGGADGARYLQRIEDAAARMGLLVDDLLLLARLDQQRPLEQRPVDLLAVAAAAVGEARAATPARRLRLEGLGGPLPPLVTGDESRLRQVIDNLLANALTHTPDAGSVDVRVGTRAAGSDDVAGGLRVVLEVADDGPGLPADEAQRVFERFYRADPSRSRGHGGTGGTGGAGGAGLGLSIVAALVAAHGGRVELDTAPGHGATFRVILPAAAVSADPSRPAALTGSAPEA